MGTRGRETKDTGTKDWQLLPLPEELGRPWQVRELGRPWRIQGFRRPWRIWWLGRPWRIQGFRRPWRDRLRGRVPSPHPSLYAGAILPPPKKSLGKVEASGHLRMIWRRGHLRALSRSGLWRALSRSGLWAGVSRGRRAWGSRRRRRWFPRGRRAWGSRGRRRWFPCRQRAWESRRRRRWFPADGGLEGAADDGGLVLAWGRTLSRHRRIPSLHLIPVVSGRSTGQW